ncbi:MAG: SRPBCC family protein, partial [Gaiellaceae bacterium]
DVWSFLAEPYHLSDWWPGIAGVQPDRRGLAPGARWQIQAPSRPGLIRRPGAGGTVLIVAVETERRVAFQLVDERVEAEVVLQDSGPGRTTVTLTVEAPFLSGVSRRTAVRALSRLYTLCQTAAEI